MKRFYLSVLTLILIISILDISKIYASCNTQIIDSLQQLIAKQPDGKLKVDLLLELSNQYVNEEFTNAEKTAARALSLARTLDYNRGINEALRLLAKIWIDSNYEIAEKYSMELFERGRKNDDIALQNIAYNFFGIIKSNENNLSESNYYYKKALINNSDSFYLAAIYHNIGINYRMAKQYDSAYSYFQSAVRINIEKRNLPFLCKNYILLAQVCINLDSLSSAADFISKCRVIVNKTGNRELDLITLETEGQLFAKSGDYNKQIEYLRRGLKLAQLTQSWDEEKVILFELQDAYSRIGKIDSSYFFLLRYNKLSDSIKVFQQSRLIDRMKLSIAYEKQEEITKLRNDARMIKLWGAIVILFMLLIIISLVTYIYRRKFKIKSIEANTIAVENLDLKQELGEKERKLTISILNLAENNELVTKVSAIFENTEIKGVLDKHPEIDHIVNDLRSSKKTNIWQQFENEFIKIHPVFFEKLSTDFPSVTSNEKRLCALVKLNLSAKEISLILHIEPGSIEVARTRLRKKFNLTGSTISLHSFLTAY